MKEKIHFNSFEEMYQFARGVKAREPKEYVEPKKKKKKKETKDEVLQTD